LVQALQYLGSTWEWQVKMPGERTFWHLMQVLEVMGWLLALVFPRLQLESFETFLQQWQRWYPRQECLRAEAPQLGSGSLPAEEVRALAEAGPVASPS